MISIYIEILWDQKKIHRLIPGEMVFFCIQFRIITNKLVYYVLVYGVAIVFVITTTGNKCLAVPKLVSRDLVIIE